MFLVFRTVVFRGEIPVSQSGKVFACYRERSGWYGCSTGDFAGGRPVKILEKELNGTIGFGGCFRRDIVK